MRENYIVEIYNDSPAAVPRKVNMEIAEESVENARQRGQLIAASIYTNGVNVSVMARKASERKPDDVIVVHEDVPRVTFDPTYFERVISVAGNECDFIRVTMGGWFDRECVARITKAGRNAMALAGIPFKADEKDMVRRISIVDRYSAGSYDGISTRPTLPRGKP